MRLNKFISSTGLYSRRKADELIKDRRVSVNGETGIIGQDVNENDKVYVDGKPLEINENNVYIILNKPRGITCTTERHIEGNIIDFVNHTERIFPVGRLDKDSEGLIILTKDGDIVNKILREGNDKKKEYIVTVNKSITSNFIRSMSEGVEIYNPVRNEYTVTQKCDVSKINDRTFKIILSQGLNRQIRRMCTALEYKVINLKRVKIMDLTLEGLNTGEWRNLTSQEIENLKI